MNHSDHYRPVRCIVYPLRESRDEALSQPHTHRWECLVCHALRVTTPEQTGQKLSPRRHSVVSGKTTCEGTPKETLFGACDGVDVEYQGPTGEIWKSYWKYILILRADFTRDF